MAGILDQTIDQGTTYTNNITVYQVDGITPMNLTGYTVASKMRKNHTSSTSHDITSVLVAPLSSGVVKFSLTSAETAAIKAGYYYYDAEITSATGNVIRVIEGKIHIKPNITK